MLNVAGCVCRVTELNSQAHRRHVCVMAGERTRTPMRQRSYQACKATGYHREHRYIPPEDRPAFFLFSTCARLGRDMPRRIFWGVFVRVKRVSHGCRISASRRQKHVRYGDVGHFGGIAVAETEVRCHDEKLHAMIFSFSPYDTCM